MKRIYLDNSATTPLDPDVLKAMLPYFTDVYGNPNSPHSFGEQANRAVISAREKIAELLNVKPQEIYFTSGGTEADNFAIKCACRANKKHVIVSAIEHAAVLSSAKQLIERGFEVTYLQPDSSGIIKPETLKSAITKDTALVSVMAANNETGVIQPIKELARLAHEYGALFHTDAVQAIGSIDLDIKDVGADLLSLSAHKFYGPKGVGLLYVKSGVSMDKLIGGGLQERGLRGGTTNVPLVAGLAVALEKAIKELRANSEKISALRDLFVKRVMSEIPDVSLNGSAISRLPQNANLMFKGVDGAALLTRLDLSGVAASAGSACSSGSLEPSHVLTAMGLTKEQAKSSLRFSFGKYNTAEEVNTVVDILKDAVFELRELFPLFKMEKPQTKYV